MPVIMVKKDQPDITVYHRRNTPRGCPKHPKYAQKNRYNRTPNEIIVETGTNDNVGMLLQQSTYDKSKVQTFMATLSDAAHQYIESNGGEERKVIVAWMRYWVYNDTGARNFF